MTIQQANQYFAALPDGFADPAQLGALLPASVQQVQFVGVAGTAGKTAVARLLAAILHAQGIRAGVYHAGCEPLAARIRVDGKPVDEALLCRAADALAAQQRGQRRQHERAQKDERVRKAQFPVRPQHDDDRQDEHSLQLKRQRQRETRRRARGLSFQRKRQSPQRTGRVQAVALGEHATV